jgi:hypothetical protein
MDETMYLSTIYTPNGLRVAFELGTELERVKERAPLTAKAFGEDYTFKLWVCKEIPMEKKT